jgi:tetratricopeptide (TPR) repeat protein
VYTIVLPPPPPESKPAAPPPKTSTEWDEIRGQIRGTGSGSSSTPNPKRRSVDDTVLELLAKNGHRFSQLGDQESLTVSIIFRLPDQIHHPRSPRGNPLAIDINAIHEVDPLTGTLVSVGSAVPSDGTEPIPSAGGKRSSEKKKPREGGEKSADDSSPRDYELLGDLHLKQGQGIEALRAYQQALAKSSDHQQVAEIYLKLAQLHLTVQKDEAEARQALMHAREFLALANAAQTPGQDKAVSKPASAASPLPARLIITASKRLLDQVGAGKMSLEDFKKAATVEHLTFSSPQK